MSDGENDTQLTVPKFSSFKAKEPPKPAQPAGERSRDRKRSHSRDHRREKRHRAHHSHEARRRGERDLHLDQPSDARQPQTSLPASTKSSIFVVDTKGDRLISKYGLDRAKVPAYYRHGGGRVLGTIGRLVIHRDGPRDQFSLRFPGEGLGSLAKDGLRSKSFRPNKNPIRLRAKASTATEDEDFLAVGSSKKRKRHGISSQSDEDEGPSYRSIEGKAKVKTDFDSSSSSSDSEDEVVTLEQDNPLKWKSIQLNRRVKEHPGDIDAWIELVDHQDDLQRAGETIDDRTTENTAHSFSEIKVNMLESALSNAVVMEDRAVVLVRLMREGVKVWPSKIAANKWSEVEKDEESNFELWRAHLDFAMSHIAMFQYDDVRQMLLGRLRAILSRSDGLEDKNWQEAIYVFLRTTVFMHDSGYKELAVASWQAILELNFSGHVSADLSAVMESFHDFWESEAPRLGDAEAKGWKHYVSSGGRIEAPEPQAHGRVEDDISTRDAYKAWGNSERCHAERAKMPARTMDDGTEDDPFRVVMFSDIEPYLFVVSDASKEGESGKLLLDAFLVFCGLPPAFLSSQLAELAFTDQFTLRSTMITRDIPSASPFDHVDAEEEKRPPPTFHNTLNAAFCPSLLFPGPDWFHYFGPAMKDLPVAAIFAMNLLKQLIHEADVESLALYYLGFSFAKEPSLVKKSAKALLKKFPNNAALYNAYALAEFANNNVDVGEKVLLSAMEAPSLSAGPSGFQLTKSLSWAALKGGRKMLAIARLCSVIDKSLGQATMDIETMSPTVILKAKQEITSNIHQSLYEGMIDYAAVYMEGAVLLSYLTDGGNTEPTSEVQGNISAAMNTIADMSAELKARGNAGTRPHERTLQFGAQILYLNATLGPFRRIYLREQLSTFLEWFPQNTIFLSLMEWADSSLRVIDETRQILYDRILIRQRDCVTSRIFSIEHEISHGNTNTVRAAFEHALTSDICRTNIGLWISYIRYTVAQKELRRKVKDVFYRALGHCPWSKELMMEAFGSLIRDMKSDELRSVYNTITGKGLRVHLDLEEYVDRWQKDRQTRR